MAERRIPAKIAAALGVRPGEGAAALLFFLYFFLITAPFTIVKSVRDASYLDDIGVRHLPWAYATAALVAGADAFVSKASLEHDLLPAIQGVSPIEHRRGPVLC